MDPELRAHLTEGLVASGYVPDAEPPSQEHEENARKLNIKMIKPPQDLEFIFTTNPIYCGLVSFNFLLDFETTGLALCNWHKTIWPMAHLYSAFRQTSDFMAWPQMERLTQIHMTDIFAGQLPLSGHEIYTRFLLSTGVSTTSFARNPRRGNEGLRWKPGSVGTKLKTSATSDVFRPLFEGKGSLEACLVRMERLIYSSRKPISKKQVTHSALTPLEFLSQLTNLLPPMVKRLEFDYITLTKDCAKLLKDIRNQFQGFPGKSCPVKRTTNSADQTLPSVVHDALQRLQNDRSINRNTSYGPELQIASSLARSSILTSNPTILVPLFNALSRHPRSRQAEFQTTGTSQSATSPSAFQATWSSSSSRTCTTPTPKVPSKSWRANPQTISSTPRAWPHYVLSHGLS